MVSKVIYSGPFEKALKKMKDARIKERVKKQTAEIVERPDIGKPLSHDRKGERSVRVPPFRIIYKIDGETLTFLEFEKRDKVY